MATVLGASAPAQGEALSLAIFLPSLEGGGAQRNALNLAIGIEKRGLPVQLVLAEARGVYMKLVPETIPIVDLDSAHVVRSLPRFVSFLRRERPETVLAVMDHVNIVALLAQRIARTSTRTIVSTRTIMSLARHGAVPKREAFLPPLARLTYPWADTVIAVSQGAAEDLSRVIGLDSDRIQVIYNPVVTSEMLERQHEPSAHPWFNPGEPPVICAAGRLAPEKDFATLLRAFRLMHEQQPSRLMILGEGPLRHNLETLIAELGIAESVSLPGYVENPYPYMANSAVFVLSSAWEGLPTVLIEAMAFGTPVVSTDCPGGAAEILEDGHHGQLVNVGDAQALANAILDSLLSPRNADQLRSRAMDFHVDKIVEEYISLFADWTVERPR